ncbi:hypothetical protein NC652_020707 [Populus alba x Populus x berolinensis]|nr:hypothetical protein NC652_020700 [Populus alba x Populus x berolinensis]KAJ6909796.1 hypothetical protein NC652_020707 [Populus alba x Populus x berolinensis]
MCVRTEAQIPGVSVSLLFQSKRGRNLLIPVSCAVFEYPVASN